MTSPPGFQQIGDLAWTNGRHTISIVNNGTGLRIERESYDDLENGDIVHLGSVSIYDGELPSEGLAIALRDLV